MTKLSEILEYTLSLAPAQWKEDWDNVGLLCGRKEKAISKVLVALDMTMEVAQEAKEKGAQLIVTHQSGKSLWRKRWASTRNQVYQHC